MAIDKNQVREKMAKFLKKPVEKLTDEALLKDFVVESLILVEMIIYLQEEFRVRFSQEQLQNVRTVSDLLKLFS